MEKSTSQTATNTKIQATQQQLQNRNKLKSPVKAHSTKLTPIVHMPGEIGIQPLTPNTREKEYLLLEEFDED